MRSKISQFMCLFMVSAAMVGCGKSDGGPAAGTPAPGKVGSQLFELNKVPSNSGSIFGVWAMSREITKPNVQGRIAIRKGEVTVAARCTFKDGSQATVEASASAVVDEASSTIDVLEAKNKDVPGPGNENCYVRIDKVKNKYTLEDGKLYLTRLDAIDFRYLASEEKVTD